MAGKLLHEDLSYILQGIFINVRKTYVSGHKESLYQHALAEGFGLQNLHSSKSLQLVLAHQRLGKRSVFTDPIF